MIQSFSQFEGKFLLWVQEYIRTDFLTAPLCILTKTKVTVALCALAIIILFAFKKTRAVSVACAISCVLSFILCNLILKNLFDRARPFTVIDGLSILVKVPSDSSFPSGHTSFCFACATVMFCMLPKKIGISAFIVALVISFSRLYVGVHFPSDVLTGAVVGILCAVLSMTFCRKIFSESKNVNKRG